MEAVDMEVMEVDDIGPEEKALSLVEVRVYLTTNYELSISMEISNKH